MNLGNYLLGKKIISVIRLIKKISFKLNRISDKILDDMLKEAVSEFDFGEKIFVEKFIQRELDC